MRNNYIEDLRGNTLQDLSHLEILDLRYNRLRSVPPLTEMPQLRQILLDSNRITRVDAHTFSGNPKLQLISLQNNAISTIALSKKKAGEAKRIMRVFEGTKHSMNRTKLNSEPLKDLQTVVGEDGLLPRTSSHMTHHQTNETGSLQPESALPELSMAHGGNMTSGEVTNSKRPVTVSPVVYEHRVEDHPKITTDNAITGVKEQTLLRVTKVPETKLNPNSVKKQPKPTRNDTRSEDHSGDKNNIKLEASHDEFLRHIYFFVGMGIIFILRNLMPAGRLTPLVRTRHRPIRPFRLF